MNVRKVSVICPVFNEEKFIEVCIMSIIEQDYPQDMMEVLFVDGRSTDKTREIIERYMRQYPFIKLLDNPERIVPYALNRGRTLHLPHELHLGTREIPLPIEC